LSTGLAQEKGIRQRSCLVCRQQADKAGLLRLVLDDEEQVWPDLMQKAPGRGAYVCWKKRCLHGLHDKQFARAWKGKQIAAEQADMLRARIADGLLRVCRQGFGRHSGQVCIGRDAVMHRMWKKAPMMVLMASDAGAALQRQIQDACSKRQAAGYKTELVIFTDSATLSALVERDVVSVLALNDLKICTSLRQYCLWFGQLCDME